jgi:sugar lactone lactonase YvrE
MTLYPQELASFDCSGKPADCATSLTAARAQAGQLLTFTPGGTWNALAAVGADDYTWSTTNTSLTRSPPNANPYGVLGVAAGAYVADAGANTLDWVSADGAHTVISGLPLPAPGGFPGDAVPTCVTMVRGNLYAADLSGRLWKRSGSYTPTQVTVAGSDGKSLIHHVTGCASDTDGNIYLVDMWGTPGPPIPAGPASVANTGSVVELSADGSASVVASGLNFPNGIAVSKDGSLYVTTNSTCTATGTPFPYCAQGGGLVRIANS